MSRLDFSKAPWFDIKARLFDCDWSQLKDLVKSDVKGAHEMFMETLLSILEELVPQKVLGKKFGRCKRCKVRRSCWRKLARINKRLLSTKSVKVIAKLLNQKQSAENTLKSSYSSEGWEQLWAR